MSEKYRPRIEPGEHRDPSIVHGEIDTGDTPLDREASLQGLEREFLRDAQLEADWQETASETDPQKRIEALLDRLNAHRRELNASDAEKAHKDARDLMFSKLSNRLRELI